MGRHSKFTQPIAERILEALKVGASRRTASAIAGIDEATLRRWMERGKKEAEGPWREFHDAVLEAEAHPNARALGIIYREMETRPDLAWKFIERREPGYAPAVTTTGPAQPIVIQLSFADGTPLALTETTVIDVEDSSAERTDPASLPGPRDQAP